MFTILWDNDGVLVDTEGFYFRATKTVLETVGVELTPEQYVDISLRHGQSVFRLAAERGVGAEEIARLRARRDRAYEKFLRTEPCAVEGAEDVLQSLYGRVRMGVVSSTRREHFDIAHARTGLPQYLDFIITHEDYPRTKPHPDAYRTALERHRLEPRQCVVIEDSERGLAAAVAAGLECWIVRSEWSKNGDFRRARKVLQRITDVPAEIQLLLATGLP